MINHTAVVMTTLDEDPDILERAIQSYLNQRHRNFTLYISTIAGDLSEVWAKRSGQIRVIAMDPDVHPGKGPRGSFAQINMALAYIPPETSWFSYASGNDHAEPEKLQREIQCCIREKAQVCYSAYRINDRRRHGRRRHVRYPRLYSYAHHLEHNFVHDCALVSMKLIRKHGPFDLSLNNMAFWHFWLTVYEQEGAVFTTNNVPTWTYHIDDNSQHIRRWRDKTAMEANRRDQERMLARHGK
jgi:hypothetical protein